MVTIKCKQGVTKKVVIRARKVTTKLLQKTITAVKATTQNNKITTTKKAKAKPTKTTTKTKPTRRNHSKAKVKTNGGCDKIKKATLNRFRFSAPFWFSRERS